MREQELRKRYETEKDIYAAWGKYVKTEVVNKISNGDNNKAIFKMQPQIRVKNVDSLIEKAFYRKDKTYLDPYNEITDKVGVRFVVLLYQELQVIKQYIESHDRWDFSKDRDFEQERENSPTTFEYQSVHYIVRNKCPFKYNGVEIPSDLPCEVQIRTSLQHTYCELSHDTTYKPKTKAKPEVQRIIARSIALIETTDTLFQEVKDMINEEQTEFNNLLPELTKLYSERIRKPKIESKINSYIIDAYKEYLHEKHINPDSICSYLDNKQFINEIIINKYDNALIYRQPIILLLYYLISSSRYTALELWPLTESTIKPLFSDLGIAFPEL